MNDKVTGIRHRVSTDGGAGPHAMVPGPRRSRGVPGPAKVEVALHRRALST
jgi:hypothetical protein